MTNLLAHGTASALIDMHGDQTRRGEFMQYVLDGLETTDDKAHFTGAIIGILLAELDKRPAALSQRRAARRGAKQ